MMPHEPRQLGDSNLQAHAMPASSLPVPFAVILSMASVMIFTLLVGPVIATSGHPYKILSRGGGKNLPGSKNGKGSVVGLVSSRAH